RQPNLTGATERRRLGWRRPPPRRSRLLPRLPRPPRACGRRRYWDARRSPFPPRLAPRLAPPPPPPPPPPNPAPPPAPPPPPPLPVPPPARPPPAPTAPAPRAVPKPAPSAPPPAGEAPPTEQFRRDLLEVVSARTGYPIDALDETLPLEAALGIDSIKTVEIF